MSIEPRRTLRVLTNSEVACYQTCPRAYQHRYVDLRRPVEKRDALAFGTLIHEALEAWLLAPAAERVDAALAAIGAADAIDPFALAKARAMIVGYHARWADERIEVIGAEIEFRAPLVEPYTMHESGVAAVGGKMDALVRIPSGPHEGLWVMEHKTSSEDIRHGAPYWRRLAIDSQVSTYIMGARAMGHDVRGVLYDVLGKVGLRPLGVTKARTTPESPADYECRVAAAILAEPDEYYRRGYVVRTATEERDAAEDLWSVHQQIDDATTWDRYPRNPRACMRYGSACEYFDVCTGVTSIDDQSRFRTADSAHEELA